VAACAAAEQVVVSPYGAGEWAPGDMEALLCGCLLVKPRPGAVSTYPLPLRAGHALLGAAADWRGLGGVLLNALEVRPGGASPMARLLRPPVGAAAARRRGAACCRAGGRLVLPRGPCDACHAPRCGSHAPQQPEHASKAARA
jgi:hypothetical protein